MRMILVKKMYNARSYLLAAVVMLLLLGAQAGMAGVTAVAATTTSAGVSYQYVPLKENVASLAQLTVKNSSSSFKTYKVVIIKDNLRIQKKASKSSKSAGSYKIGSIVDITGKSGIYLKTKVGYISAAATKLISGMYMKAAKNSVVLNSSSLKVDKRILQAGKIYRIVDAKGGYLRVRVGRLYGYVPMNSIRSLSDQDPSKVTIAWEAISKKAGNQTLLVNSSSYVNTKSSTIGLDVISPTWFDVTGSSTSPSGIDLLDIADKSYVDTAHANGYEVWARFCEMDKKRASVIFNNNEVRTKLMDKLIQYAVQYDLDGINVDFEALGIDNRDGFTAFMKELYPKLKKYNLNVSIDITKISPTSTLYSLCYDRPALAKVSDYLMLMAYDEYYSSSKEAGSVGSYGWVEAAIKDILKEGVPASKLILGAPFYLRDFSVVPYDFVMANQTLKVYSSANTATPVALGNVNVDDRFKCVGSYSNWYIIDYKGTNGYVLKNDTQFYKANTTITTPGAIGSSTTEGGVSVTTGTAIGTTQGSAITFTITEDTVILKKAVSVYSAANEGTASVLGEVTAKAWYKYVGKEKDCYIVNYNGGNGYIRTTQSSLYKADTRAIESKAVSMQTALDKIRDNGGQTSYDDASKQYVGTYVKDGIKHYIWLETADSMKWRMEFVNKYKLPGAAFWSLYWKTTNGIWDIIRSTLTK